MGRWPRSGLGRTIVGGDQQQQLWSFLGKLKAHGLEVDQGSAEDPATQQKVQWIRRSDGAVVAEVFGSDYAINLGGGNTLTAHQTKIRTSKPGAATQEAGINAQAYTKTGGIIDLPAAVNAYALPDGGGAGNSVNIIDEAGNSSFVRLGDKSNNNEVLIYAGQIATGGGITRGTGGFTVSHVAASGIYTINYTTPFTMMAGIPIATCVNAAGGSQVARVSAVAAGSCTIQTINLAGALGDIAFTFFVIGYGQ